MNHLIGNSLEKTPCARAEQMQPKAQFFDRNRYSFEHKHSLHFVLFLLMVFGLFATPIPTSAKWDSLFGNPGDDVGHSVKQTTDGGYIIAGYAAEHATEQVVLQDNFDNGLLDPKWDVAFENANGWTYSEYGTVLEVTDIGATVLNATSPCTWSRVKLGQQVTAVNDFDVRFDFSWDSESSVNDMQYINLMLKDKSDEIMAQAAYSDAWVSHRGGVLAVVGENYYGSGLNSLPFSGNGRFEFVRNDGDIEIFWDGALVQSGRNSAQLGRVEIWFSFCNYNDGVWKSKYGKARVDLVSVTTPKADVYLIKTDAKGEKMWSQLFGGPQWDSGHSVQQATDGGYIIAGYTESFGAKADVYLIKTDADGGKTWSQLFGGPQWDVGYAVQQTTDGGYIIVGYTESFGAKADVYLIKTDADGGKTWSQLFGGPQWDVGHSVQQTTDGGYIIVGSTESFGAKADIYLIKTDAKGKKMWSQLFGGPQRDVGHSVQQTADGGYVIVGSTESFGAKADVYLIKTDAKGKKMWSQLFGGPQRDVGHSVQQTADGGYIIVGSTESFGAKADVYLVKTDADGEKTWSELFGGPQQDVGYSVQQTRDGGYVMSGYSDSFGTTFKDVYLIYAEGKRATPWLPLLLFED